jgi:hypothetical protein
VIVPYRVPAVSGGPEAARRRSIDWSWVALLAVVMALGFAGVPALVTLLALESHSVLPELFLAFGVFGGGSLALLFAGVAAPGRGGR